MRADWEVDTADLRTWLRKLRGLCTHPQVGQLLNAGDRLHKPGVLKSMEEVLEVRSSSLELQVSAVTPAKYRG